jgi:hypothetical protein
MLCAPGEYAKFHTEPWPEAAEIVDSGIVQAIIDLHIGMSWVRDPRGQVIQILHEQVVTAGKFGVWGQMQRLLIILALIKSRMRGCFAQLFGGTERSAIILRKDAMLVWHPQKERSTFQHAVSILNAVGATKCTMPEDRPFTSEYSRAGKSLKIMRRHDILVRTSEYARGCFPEDLPLVLNKDLSKQMMRDVDLIHPMAYQDWIDDGDKDWPA